MTYANCIDRNLAVWPDAVALANSEGFTVIESGERVPAKYTIRDGNETRRFYPRLESHRTVFDFVAAYAAERKRT